MSAFSLPPSRPKASPNFRSSAAGLALSPTKAQSTLRFDQEPPPKRPVFEPVHKKKRPISFDDGNKDDANPKGLPVFTLQDDGRSPKARRPAVVFTRCATEADDLVACLQGPLAFDMEWPVVRRKGATEQKTALIQIGDANMIVLIQISAMRWVIPPGLLDVLQSPDILKLGVNIRGDALKLRRDFPHVRMRGFLDISHCARKVDALAMGPGRAILSLATLTAAYLDRHLSKPSVRTGDWASKTLSDEARTYAACDILSTIGIWEVLLKKMKREEAAAAEDWAGPRGLDRVKSLVGDLLKEEEEERAKLKEKEKKLQGKEEASRA